ncbi:MAG: hypothetical protein MI974_01680 [Chitinophagales bacterium]|nr:hypothetical protein [Chitinophagales bacterium]
MTYVYLRYGLIALFAVLGIVLHVQLGIEQSWYLYAAAGLLLFSHLFFGNVWLAFNFLKRGEVLKAQQTLKHTWAPNLLFKSNKAYYFFTQGMIFLQSKQLDKAKPLLEKACDLKLKHNNDNALAHLNLAHIHFVQKNKAEAIKNLEAAKAFNPSDLMIKDNLKKMEAAMSGG